MLAHYEDGKDREVEIGGYGGLVLIHLKMEERARREMVMADGHCKELVIGKVVSMEGVFRATLGWPWVVVDHEGGRHEGMEWVLMCFF